MSIEKATVKARIKVLHPNTNLSQARRDEIADRLINDLAEDADETAIDAAIQAYNKYNPFSEIAKNDDVFRDLKAKAEKAAKVDEPKPEPKTIEIPDDTPEWAKAILKQNQELSEKVNGFERNQKHQSITDRFNNDPRVKAIPDWMRKGYVPTSDDDFETNIEELTGNYTKYAEDNKLSLLGNDKPAGGIGNDKKDGKLATKEEVDAVARHINI